MSLTAAETIDAVGVWLVELTFGGQVHRFATRAVDVVDKSGTSHRYHIGLEDFPHDFSSSGIDLTIGMSIEADEDWAAIAARGVQLERAPAVLRRHFTGQTLERARVIVRGITMDVEYGAVGEPMELSIAMAADEAADTLPPVTSVISADTWPVTNALFDVGVEGAQYNYIIGYPGTLGDGKGAPAVPAPAVDIDSPITTAMRLEVAGHRIESGITVEYAPFATSARYRKRVVVTAQRDATTAGPPTTADDSRITENIRCRRSQLQYGVKPFTFSTSAVWDDVTASLIAADLANRFALPHRRIQYQGGAELEALEIGSVVLLTDTEIYIDAEVALVMEITAGGGEDVTLELVMVDNPVNHPRKIT